jgi:branched-chain amino acid transport system ATP-binding protein/neutral amino acid transport system ATP-binding protein
MAALLEVRNLAAGYGRGNIVEEISLAVEAGEIVTLIGPNGAGKSTLIKALAGVVRPSTGVVRISERDVAGLSASRIAHHGLAYVPQEANIFRSLTVQENLEMGAWLHRRERARRLAYVFDLFPILTERRAVRAGSLSGGQRQMVAFSMALMVEPRVLLLDEPSAGLSPRMVEEMFETVTEVNRRGVAILMVEQNAIQALGFSHRGIVMASGRVQLADAAARLLDNKEVGELYLGSRT